MSSHYVVCPAASQDGAAIAELFNNNPDAGRIAIAAHYQLDPLHIATSLDPQTIVGVARDTTTKQIIGVGMARLDTGCQVSGKPEPMAVLNFLLVAPSHRRQGVATELARWRIEAVRSQLEDDPLIVAGIQKRNEGSLAVVRSWSKTIVGPMQTCLVATSPKPPQSDMQVSIRWAEPSDLEEIATRLNEFYGSYAFFSPKTADSLSLWLSRSPLNRPVRRYAVVVDRNNNLLAGLGITEQHRFMQMIVNHMPLVVRGLNRVIGMVPADGNLRQSAITHFWHRPDQVEAARLLWQQVQWLMDESSTHLTFSYDPRGPFPDIIRLPRWLPRGAYVLALNRSLSAETQLLYPI